MKRKVMAIIAVMLMGSLALNGCGTSSSAAAAPKAEEKAAEAPAQEETEEAEAAETAEDTAEAAVETEVQADAGAAKIIEDIATIQAFTDEAVADADIEAIVNAGVNAPSAMNGQPWHISVVMNKDTMEQIAGDMSMGRPGGMTPPAGFTPPSGEKPEGAPEGFTPPSGDKPEGAPEAAEGKDMPTPPASTGAKAGIADAPLVIIVSCKNGSDLDAGLAIQNMSAEAQLLGYGTKLVSSPKMALNGEKQAEYKELLGIPEDMSAVCMLLVGVTDTENYDAVAGATARNDVSEVVTYIK